MCVYIYTHTPKLTNFILLFCLVQQSSLTICVKGRPRRIKELQIDVQSIGQFICEKCMYSKKQTVYKIR